MEEDAVFNTWLHQSFSGEMKFRKLENRNYELDGTNRKPITDYPVYLNVRNERCFFRSPHQGCTAGGKQGQNHPLNSETATGKSSSPLSPN
jgi:hypothetical protein